MTEQPFRQTPLFQLNLLLWLSMPAGGDWITPIFWNSGFETYTVGASIRVPIEAQIQANSLGIRNSIASSVAPDLLLRDESRRTLMTIECKANSFGPASDNTSQALGILACTGPYVADYFGIPQPIQWTAWGAYAVPHPNQGLMSQTLIFLAKQLNTAGIDQCTATAFGIDVTADGVYIDLSELPQLPLNVAGRQRVMKLETDEDPRPLYLIPLDPSIDAQDEYGKQVVQERLRAAFASLVATRLDQSSFVITWEELMTEAIQVWPIWKDRGSTRNLLSQTKTYVRRILSEISRLGVTAEPTNDGFALAGIESTPAQQIRRYLMGIAYRQGELDLWQQGVQLGFDDVDGWDIVRNNKGP